MQTSHHTPSQKKVQPSTTAPRDPPRKAQTEKAQAAQPTATRAKAPIATKPAPKAAVAKTTAGANARGKSAGEAGVKTAARTARSRTASASGAKPASRKTAARSAEKHGKKPATTLETLKHFVSTTVEDALEAGAHLMQSISGEAHTRKAAHHNK